MLNGEAISIEKSMYRGMFRPLILSLLDRSMMRFYQIFKAIRQITGRKPSLSTIHDILVELESKKLIKSITTQTSEKYYQITENGRKTLNEIRAKCKSHIIDIISLIFEVQEKSKNRVNKRW
ncbi:MAG: hypothetical protein DRJ18_01650 [Candidatus Methanomethylicota archaeon]|nr:PadR family transcriptional regulator [Candidatus Culexmicrobium cathedralense]RLE48612.1 MAG: hypothetical protein DRJ18_01650 [Candidatus Verstraetearchaeota archaeon]